MREYQALLSRHLIGLITLRLVMLVLDLMQLRKYNVRSNSSLGWFSYHDGNIIGGALIGMGMGLTGACPGTVIVQLAQGISSSRATAIGAIVGGIFFAKFGQIIRGQENPVDGDSSNDATTIASKFNFDSRKVFMILETTYLGVVVLSTFFLPRQSFTTMPAIFGGLTIGAAQLLSLLLTSKSLGVAIAYEQLGRYFWKLTGSDTVAIPQYLPLSMIFALGIYGGSFVFSTYFGESETEALVDIPIHHSVIGGFALSVGARIAGGCTSGHGLSGLSALSYSSLITTAAMFGSGIGTSLLVQRS